MSESSKSKKSIITSLSLFIWTPDAEYLTLKKNAGPWKIWTKRFMEANKKREVSNSVVVQIHQEKNTFALF